MRYQSGNVIRVSGDTDEKFLYCLIYEILVFEDKKIFIVKPLKVLEFSKKLCAYEVLLMDSAPSKAIFMTLFTLMGFYTLNTNLIRCILLKRTMQIEIYGLFFYKLIFSKMCQM